MKNTTVTVIIIVIILVIIGVVIAISTNSNTSQTIPTYSNPVTAPSASDAIPTQPLPE